MRYTLMFLFSNIFLLNCVPNKMYIPVESVSKNKTSEKNNSSKTPTLDTKKYKYLFDSSKNRVCLGRILSVSEDKTSMNRGQIYTVLSSKDYFTLISNPSNASRAAYEFINADGKKILGLVENNSKLLALYRPSAMNYIYENYKPYIRFSFDPSKYMALHKLDKSTFKNFNNGFQLKYLAPNQLQSPNSHRIVVEHNFISYSKVYQYDWSPFKRQNLVEIEKETGFPDTFKGPLTVEESLFSC